MILWPGSSKYTDCTQIAASAAAKNYAKKHVLTARRIGSARLTTLLSTEKREATMKTNWTSVAKIPHSHSWRDHY